MSNGKNAIGLSKTSILKGMQCPKALYLSQNTLLLQYLPARSSYWGEVRINPGFSNSEDNNAFTYQFIAGVAYAFNEQWSVDAQYRYIGTSDVTIDGADFDHSSNDLMLGLRFSF